MALSLLPSPRINDEESTGIWDNTPPGSAGSSNARYVSSSAPAGFFFGIGGPPDELCQCGVRACFVAVPGGRGGGRLLMVDVS